MATLADLLRQREESDAISATPQNAIGPLSNALASGVEWLRSPLRTQQMQGLGALLESTGIPKTLERISYGEPLTNINQANVPLMKPETIDALMTVAGFAPEIKAAAKFLPKDLPVGMSMKEVSSFKFPQEEAFKLAQQRAALPIEKGGLGLAADNTAAQRASAMGFDTESLHGTSNPSIEKFDPNLVGTKAGNRFDDYMWSTSSPEAATGYSLNVKSYEALPEVAKLKDEKNQLLKEISKSIQDKDMEKMGDLRKQLNSIADEESKIYDSFKKGEILSEGSTVYPLSLQSSEFMPYEASGKSWIRANRPAIEQSQDIGYQGVNIKNVIDNPNTFLGVNPANTFATENPDLLRSRFAAFDPWRKTAATAAAMGVAAPDLLAEELRKRK